MNTYITEAQKLLSKLVLLKKKTELVAMQPPIRSNREYQTIFNNTGMLFQNMHEI